MPTRTKPYRLVDYQASEDTVTALEELLAAARDSGTDQLIGIAFVAMYRGQRYIVDTAGECRRNPTFTRGMVAELHDSLSTVLRLHQLNSN